MPTASTIAIAETLDLLDGPHSALSAGFQAGQYALWLGSGISRERVVGLDGVLSKLLENLRLRITGVDCEHHCAFDTILGLADLSDAEKAQVDLAQPVRSWPIDDALIDRLWTKYSKVLRTEVQGQPLDYLLWDVLDFATTFAAQKADAEHLAIGMLVLEGVVSDLATANWDGLLEAAMVELGRPNETFLVAVTGGDLHGPPGIGRLYKFHGCANRAIANEAEYRPLLVAREAAVTHWGCEPALHSDARTAPGANCPFKNADDWTLRAGHQHPATVQREWLWLELGSDADRVCRPGPVRGPKIYPRGRVPSEL